jgi:hypothetical protein
MYIKMSQETKNLKLATDTFNLAMDNFNFVKDNKKLCGHMVSRVKEELYETHVNYMLALKEFEKSTSS